MYIIMNIIITFKMSIGVSYILLTLKVGYNDRYGPYECGIVTDFKETNSFFSRSHCMMHEHRCNIYEETNESISFAFASEPNLKPHKDFKINSELYNSTLREILNKIHSKGFCKCGSHLQYVHILSVWLES